MERPKLPPRPRPAPEPRACAKPVAAQDPRPVAIESCPHHPRHKREYFCARCGRLACEMCPRDPLVPCRSTEGGVHQLDAERPVSETDRVCSRDYVSCHVRSSAQHIEALDKRYLWLTEEEGKNDKSVADILKQVGELLGNGVIGSEFKKSIDAYRARRGLDIRAEQQDVMRYKMAATRACATATATLELFKGATEILLRGGEAVLAALREPLPPLAVGDFNISHALADPVVKGIDAGAMQLLLTVRPASAVLLPCCGEAPTASGGKPPIPLIEHRRVKSIGGGALPYSCVEQQQTTEGAANPLSVSTTAFEAYGPSGLCLLRADGCHVKLGRDKSNGVCVSRCGKYVYSTHAACIDVFEVDAASGNVDFREVLRVPGARCLAGVSESRRGELAVLDEDLPRVTVHGGTEAGCRLRNAVPPELNGADVLCEPRGVCWCDDDLCVLNEGTEMVGSSLVRVQMRPQLRLLWEQPVEDPWNIFCYGGLLYMTHYELKRVTVHDAADGTVVKTIECPGLPRGVHLPCPHVLRITSF